MSVNLLAGIENTGALNVCSQPAAPRILVMDSGLGGLTVYHAIAARMPDAALMYLADNAGFPYGSLAPDVLVARVCAAVEQAAVRYSPDIVVIACNTASTMVLPVLRSRFSIPVVGTVPAVKPAAQLSVSRHITILATPGTVARDYTRDLIARYAEGCHVTLVGATRLAAMAEAELAGTPVSDAELAAEVAACFVQTPEGRTDVVVLACTHYPLLQARLEKVAPWPVMFIDPAPAIANRVAALLGRDAAVQDNLPAQEQHLPFALFTKPVGDEVLMRRALGSRGIHDLRIEALPF